MRRGGLAATDARKLHSGVRWLAVSLAVTYLAGCSVNPGPSAAAPTDQSAPTGNSIVGTSVPGTTAPVPGFTVGPVDVPGGGARTLEIGAVRAGSTIQGVLLVQAPGTVLASDTRLPLDVTVVGPDPTVPYLSLSAILPRTPIVFQVGQDGDCGVVIFNRAPSGQGFSVQLTIPR